MPDVASAILEQESFQGGDLQARLDALNQEILTEVNRPGSINDAVLRFCRRRIDRTLKQIDLTDACSPHDLSQLYKDRTGALDILSLSREARERIEGAVRDRDIPALLASFDNKTLLACAAKHLKNQSKGNFESWIARSVRGPHSKNLRAALKSILPVVIPQ